jgi:hypothetical protein
LFIVGLLEVETGLETNQFLPRDRVASKTDDLLIGFDFRESPQVQLRLVAGNLDPTSHHRASCLDGSETTVSRRRHQAYIHVMAASSFLRCLSARASGTGETRSVVGVVEDVWGDPDRYSGAGSFDHAALAIGDPDMSGEEQQVAGLDVSGLNGCYEFLLRRRLVG